MTTIETGLGAIEGIEGDGVLEIRAIRYAEPPVGDLRFRPPVRTGSWTGTYTLAQQWSATVALFARTGDPNGAGLPDWPRYTADDRRVLILDDPCRIDVDPDETDRKIWSQL